MPLPRGATPRTGRPGLSGLLPSKRHFPILDWAPAYGRRALASDLVAATIVTIMLIPQALAYALLAGMPAVTGLYVSILPLLVYTVLGSSRVLAVGPMAVTSLMTAAAVGKIAAEGSADYLGAALVMALLSGAMLVAMGIMRLGFLANFLSHPVISGVITASGLLIATSQVPQILGVRVAGQTMPELVAGIAAGLSASNLPTLAIGCGGLAFLVWARRGLRPLLVALGLPGPAAAIAARTAPVLAVIASTLASWGLGLEARGVAVVGAVPQGLPHPVLPPLDPLLWSRLLVPALLISIVGYVESVSIAQTLAARRRQRIDPDQELLALGASNLAAGISGGFPITGGFARSVVNFEAGAETPAAGAFTALGMALATLFLTPALAHLPRATLAATIVVAVLSLVDFGAFRRSWQISRPDFAAMAATVAVTLLVGVEAGISAGVILSLALHLYRTSKPHVAIVGQVPGTEHFRNVLRHEVVTSPEVLSIRIDESLYFPNARFLEDTLRARLAADPKIRHVVLMCPAVNDVDASAFESLETINRELREAGVLLHLSEVKGPVMDKLARGGFPEALSGQIFLTQCDAMRALAPTLTAETLGAARRETLRRAG